MRLAVSLLSLAIGASVAFSAAAAPQQHARRMCGTKEEIVEEVATTVVHEVAHRFGIEDERLHELGWG